MTVRSEHARQRIAAAATLLHDLWGEGLPPGHAPWERIAADVLDVDDSLGEQQGLTVQGDELLLAVLAEALSYVPPGASLHATVPHTLISRIRQAEAVRDPDARALAIGARLLSVAIRTSGARWAGVYRHGASIGHLEASLGMTPWERVERRRIPLTGTGALCQALQHGRTTRGVIEAPARGEGWNGSPGLVEVPCVATPFPSTGTGAPSGGALMLVWPAEGDPDPCRVGTLVAPLAAEAEHLLATEH